MISVLNQQETIIFPGKSGSFLPGFIPQQRIIFDGAGFDRQPVEELKEHPEAALPPKKIEDSFYLCDLLLKESQADGIGGKVIRAAYYDRDSADYPRLIPNSQTDYLFISDVQPQNQADKDISIFRQQSTLKNINLENHSSMLVYVSYMGSLQNTITYNQELSYSEYSIEQPGTFFYSEKAVYELDAARFQNPLFDHIEIYDLSAPVIIPEQTGSYSEHDYTHAERITPLNTANPFYLPDKTAITSATQYRSDIQGNEVSSLIFLNRDDTKKIGYQIPDDILLDLPGEPINEKSDSGKPEMGNNSSYIKNYQKSELPDESTHLPDNISEFDSDKAKNTSAIENTISRYSPINQLITDLNKDHILTSGKYLFDTAHNKHEILSRSLANLEIKDITSVRLEYTVRDAFVSNILKTPDLKTTVETEETELDYGITKDLTEGITQKIESYKGDSDTNHSLELKVKDSWNRENAGLDDVPYKKEEVRVSQECQIASECFAEIMDWMDGKEDSSNFTKKELESLSECYAEQIRDIRESREIIRQRKEGDYSNLVHKEGVMLRDYIRNGEIQEGFKLVDRFMVSDVDTMDYIINAYDSKEGKMVDVNVRSDSVNAVIDRMAKGTVLWESQEFVFEGKKIRGEYISDILEVMPQARKELGDKDEYGMRLSGIIILINGKEPGRGTIPLHDYIVKPGDLIEIIYKNDAARYDEDLVLRKVA
ncbi:MAG: hypothetical protein KAK00_03755 [Nanoarchaeota archaeon]|nr:hypothetical protein [Nanoarchaeota archaeon]